MSKIKSYIFTILLILLLAFSLYITNFDLQVLYLRFDKATTFVKKMIPPDWSYYKQIYIPLLKTIQMSIAGTMIGAFLGIFTTFLYADNVNKNVPLRLFVHIIVQLIRTIPVLIIALICTFIWGIGSFAGTISLAVSTWAIMTRIGGEDLSKMPLNSYEALYNTGCGRFKAFYRTVFIEMLSGYLTNALYILETNIRHAAILGYVGAGGIGLLLNEKIAWREYSKVGMIIVMLYFVVVIIELLSMFLKNYLDGKYTHTKLTNSIIITTIGALCLYSLLSIEPVKASTLGFRVVKSIVSGILHPDINYLLLSGKDGVLFLMLETVCIAIAGTILGAIIAFIFAIFNSFRTMPLLAIPARLIVMAIRTIPVYVYGLIFIRVTGPGSFAGVLTMTMCSIGLLTKRFTVAIDNCDFRAYKAYKSMGIGWIARVKYCVILPLKAQFKQAMFYRFDVNIRSASTLGLVGAGGIGSPLIIYMNNYKWDAVGSILIVLFITVLIIEFIGNYISRRG